MSGKAQIGIIGDGQLARMLVESAEKYKITTAALVSSAETPLGSLKAPGCKLFTGENQLDAFLESSNTVIFENEFQDTEKLSAKSKNKPELFFPNLSAIGLLQNKLEQKKLFTKLDVPTAPFVEAPEFFKTGASALAWGGSARKNFEAGAVFKWSRLGYDGKGVLISQASDYLTGPLALAFFDEAAKKQNKVYAEEFIPYSTECALITARDRKNGFTYFPLVLTTQKHGVCAKVMGPASALGLTAEQEADAQKSAKKIAEALDLYGVFAVEFFLDQKGRLIANEVAPRVHNSGHLTQNAFSFNQFDAHIFCALGRFWELGRPHAQTSFYGMYNLLGPNEVVAHLTPSMLPEVPREMGRLYWYQKSETRPSRKLGHVNVTANSRQELERKLEWLDNLYEEWTKKLQALK